MAVLAADSPEVEAAKRLLDTLKDGGFRFRRTGPGADGPVLGVRETAEWIDEVFLAGFSASCHAVRRRQSPLAVPGGLPVVAEVKGDALTVLRTVVCWP